MGHLAAEYTTLQDAAGATGNGTAAEVLRARRVAVQITGTFTATVTFEGTVDGTNYDEVGLIDVSDGSVVTAPTAAGIFYLPDELPLKYLRARVSAYTSGNVTATALVVAMR